MKKYQYIVAAACILLGAAGFAGVYAMEQSQKNENQISQNQRVEEESETGSEIDIVDIGGAIVDNDNDTVPSIEDPKETESTPAEETKLSDNENTETDDAPTPVATPQEETLHFSPDKGVVWPIEGTTLLDYSMDATIYFPTLNQYQYNPSMVIAADVNSKVYFVAKGKVTNIETNEVTGCTVTQDLGDGYTAIYGQLKELNFDIGDTVESGQVVGYVSEPTKYYSVEGSNVYFQLLKDGKPVDPTEILP